ncbi:hypothetical protein Rs2_16065 [Raphanus sativus]|nr:hypothetical protein Rs2_16065 [Raphanus sativus]
MAIKRGVENDPLVCSDYGLPRHRLPIHRYYTSKWPGKKRDDRIHSQSPRAALRAVGHTQMVRREWRRPDFTPNGMNSLEGRCSAEIRHKAGPDQGSTRSSKIKHETLEKGADHKSNNNQVQWDMVPWPLKTSQKYLVCGDGWLND